MEQGSEASDVRERLSVAVQAIKEIRAYAAARTPHALDLVAARANMALEQLGIERRPTPRLMRVK